LRINDRLAQGVLFGVIPTLWVLAGLALIRLPGEVIGATIAGWTLILQYYFRKKGPKEEKTDAG